MRGLLLGTPDNRPREAVVLLLERFHEKLATSPTVSLRESLALNSSPSEALTRSLIERRHKGHKLMCVQLGVVSLEEEAAKLGDSLVELAEKHAVARSFLVPLALRIHNDMPVRASGRKTLHTAQRRVTSALLDSLFAGWLDLSFEAPTGSGKTLIYDIFNTALYRLGRTEILTPLNSLKEQISDRVKHGDALTIQSTLKGRRHYDSEDIVLLTIDEAHLSHTDNSYREAIEERTSRCLFTLAASATLGNSKSGHVGQYSRMVTSQRRIELVREGILPQPDIFYGLSTHGTHELTRDISLIPTDSLRPEERGVRKTYHTLAELLSSPKDGFPDLLQKEGGIEKGLIFVPGFKNATELLKILKSQGLAAEIAMTESKDHKEAINRYRKGQTRILISTRLLEVGFDDDDTTWVVIGNPGIAHINLLQKAGRTGRASNKDGTRTNRLIQIVDSKRRDQHLIGTLVGHLEGQPPHVFSLIREGIVPTYQQLLGASAIAGQFLSDRDLLRKDTPLIIEKVGHWVSSVVLAEQLGYDEEVIKRLGVAYLHNYLKITRETQGKQKKEIFFLSPDSIDSLRGVFTRRLHLPIPEPGKLRTRSLHLLVDSLFPLWSRSPESTERLQRILVKNGAKISRAIVPLDSEDPTNPHAARSPGNCFYCTRDVAETIETEFLLETVKEEWESMNGFELRRILRGQPIQPEFFASGDLSTERLLSSYPSGHAPFQVMMHPTQNDLVYVSPALKRLLHPL